MGELLQPSRVAGLSTDYQTEESEVALLIDIAYSSDIEPFNTGEVYSGCWCKRPLGDVTIG